MGLAASQGRMLLLTARKSDLEFRAQQISQKRLVLSQQLESISMDYENACSDRKMYINVSLADTDDGSGLPVSKQVNLTYASLISGLKALKSTDSGIDASKINTQGYQSTTAYRLVDAYGAIVVSSMDEIPGSTNKEKTTPKGDDGVYRQGKYDENGKLTESETNYIVTPQGDDDKKTDLQKLLEGNDVDGSSFEIDSKNGLVKIKTNDGKEVYYNYKTGDKVDPKAKDFKFENENNEKATFVNDKADIPKSEQTAQYEIVEGADGKVSLKEDGVVIARYVIDPTLRYGSTDASGSQDGPNYLQDCLRNGKYLLQKASTDSQTNKINWNSISWDATSNINDEWYTENDDKAKAKYDRLQKQIQNQDKKLELELDNIETQRSAVTTEIDSVKKVIDENIEGSFKTFA